MKKPVWTKLIVWRSLVRLPCTAAKSRRGHRVTSMSIRKLLELAGCFAVFLNPIMVRQAKLAHSSRWKTGAGRAVAGRPVASVWHFVERKLRTAGR